MKTRSLISLSLQISAVVLLLMAALLPGHDIAHARAMTGSPPTGTLSSHSNTITETLSTPLSPIGNYNSGLDGESAVEITTYDPVGQLLYVSNAVSNTVEVLDSRDPTRPTWLSSIDLSPYGAGVNSVAFYSYGPGLTDGLLAVAIEAEPKQSPGTVAVFDRSGTFVFSQPVGALPDMLTFTPDGQKIVVANEGEPNDDYTDDPEGSVSIISGLPNAPVVNTASFASFNDQIDALRQQGVRIFGPNATAAQDFEPEYIAVSPDSRTAYVTLQENNAIAVVDLDNATVTELYPLGAKDHSLFANKFDASNEDDQINLQPWPVLGLYQPDAIAAYQAGGLLYLVTANEGDAREYLGDPGYVEETRVADLPLDALVLANDPTLTDTAKLGRLKTTTASGDTDGDGDFDQIYSFGGRSFSIWDAASGALVYDSGSQFEQLTAAFDPAVFNDEGGPEDGEATFDNRSDDKGPEPEGVALGQVNGRTYAFIGLERVGGVMVYDVTDPQKPAFVQYINSRYTFGDRAPEGLIFIPAEDSPSGRPLLVASFEISSSVSLFEMAGLAGQTCAQEYTVQAGDWLSTIAARFLGDPLGYPAIVAATNQMVAAGDDTFTPIADLDIIEIGSKFCIPGQG